MRTNNGINSGRAAHTHTHAYNGASAIQLGELFDRVFFPEYKNDHKMLTALRYVRTYCFCTWYQVSFIIVVPTIQTMSADVSGHPIGGAKCVVSPRRSASTLRPRFSKLAHRIWLQYTKYDTEHTTPILACPTEPCHSFTPKYPTNQRGCAGGVLATNARQGHL